MTDREHAWWILRSKPLEFGNAEQIRAVRYLEAFERWGEEKEMPCPSCDGSGEVECECFDCGDIHTRECRDCDGDGTIRKETLKYRLLDDRQLWLFPEMMPFTAKGKVN